MNILKKCLELLESGREVVQVTVVKAASGTPGKAGFKLLLAEDGKLYGTVGGGALEHRAIEEARAALKSRENQILEYDLARLGMRCGGKATLVLEYLPPSRGFILFGGGHVGRALAPMLISLGFRVTIFDSRPEVKEQIAPDLQKTVISGDYNDLNPVGDRLKAAEFCFIATHGHEHDYLVLKQVLSLGTHYRYVGLIGSWNKVKTTFQRLRSEGIEVPDYVFAPVGLDLGGDTAEEIALSIAAEVVALLHGASVSHMRDQARNTSSKA